MTYGARGDVAKLGGGNRGQSDEGSDGEGLHLGWRVRSEVWIDGLMKVYQSAIVMCGNCKYAMSMHHFIPQHSA